MPDTITKTMMENRVRRISEETRLEHYVEYQNNMYSLSIGPKAKGLVDRRVFTARTKREFMNTAMAYIEGYRLPATKRTLRTSKARAKKS